MSLTQCFRFSHVQFISHSFTFPVLLFQLLPCVISEIKFSWSLNTNHSVYLSSSVSSVHCLVIDVVVAVVSPACVLSVHCVIIIN